MKISGFPGYEIDKSGRVFRNGREVQSYDKGRGYKQVKLYRNGQRYTKSIHRLMMSEPEGLDVDHKDNNKSNNHWTNLQVISHRDNVRRRFLK